LAAETDFFSSKELIFGSRRISTGKPDVSAGSPKFLPASQIEPELPSYSSIFEDMISFSETESSLKERHVQPD
jgi:hypothetical protein